jgi:transposase
MSGRALRVLFHRQYLAQANTKRINEGHSRAFIARTLHVSRRLVNEWISTYLSHGFDGLALKLATGRPPLLNKTQKSALKNILFLIQLNRKEAV